MKTSKKLHSKNTVRRSVVALGVAAMVLPVACSKKKSDADAESKRAANLAKSAGPGASGSPQKHAAPVERPLPKHPRNLGRVKVPANNPMTPGKVALGRKLFFDKRLSADGSRACYSCHENENGTGGALPKAIGAKEKQLSRHAPVMWNVAYLPRLYWDGRAGSLEAQATGAWAGGNMGVGKHKLSAKAKEIGALPDYKAAFSKVFPGDGATPATIAQAIAAFERTLFCGDTAFDRYQGGDKTALTESQMRGWVLFQGKGGCRDCHSAPYFSDSYQAEGGAFHNVGIGIDGVEEGKVDPGRQKVSGNDSDWAAYKTPTLRNVTKTAPYFHDGSVAKLEDAVRFMAAGGFANKNLDPKLVDKKLTDAEISDLTTFLGSLDCSGELKAQ